MPPLSIARQVRKEPSTVSDSNDRKVARAGLWGREPSNGRSFAKNARGHTKNWNFSAVLTFPSRDSCESYYALRQI